MVLPPEEAGTFEIGFQVKDRNEGVGLGQSVIAVKAEDNLDPVAADDSWQLTEGLAEEVRIEVLKNDIDENLADELEVVKVSTPKYGVAEIEEGLVIVYRLELNLSKEVEDEFEYTISDGKGGLSQALVKVSILASNHPPVAADDAFET